MSLLLVPKTKSCKTQLYVCSCHGQALYSLHKQNKRLKALALDLEAVTCDPSVQSHPRISV